MKSDLPILQKANTVLWQRLLIWIGSFIVLFCLLVAWGFHIGYIHYDPDWKPTYPVKETVVIRREHFYISNPPPPIESFGEAVPPPESVLVRGIDLNRLLPAYHRWKPSFKFKYCIVSRHAMRLRDGDYVPLYAIARSDYEALKTFDPRIRIAKPDK